MQHAAAPGRSRGAAASADLRLVFDQYRGVIAYVRVVDGTFGRGEAIRAMQAGTRADIDDIGFRSPDMVKTETLEAGEVGYIITGIKTWPSCASATPTTEARPATEALPGYKEARPVVFCGLYPIDTDQYPDLRDALEKLSLNDASLSYEPETSQAPGFGFRCGFLGLLHMDIVRERLEREYDLDPLATTPNVEYHVRMSSGEMLEVPLPADMPDPNDIEAVEEPYIRARISRRRSSWGDHGGQDRVRHAHRHALPVRAAGRCATTCRWPRSCSTSTTSSSHAAGASVPRLRADRLPRIEPREARHHARRGHRRRLLPGRPQGQGVLLGQGAGERLRRRSRGSSTRSRSRRRSARASSPGRR